MSGVIDSFLVALGFDADTKGAEEYKSAISSVAKTLTTIVGVAAGAATAIGAFIVSVAGQLDDLGDFAAANDVAVETIQELGHAAQLNGSSVEAVQSSIEGLNKAIGESANGFGRGAKAFENFDISAKNADGSVKKFDDVLLEVSDKMQGLSKQEAIAMASKLGIDKSLVPMLQSGRDAIVALREEAQAFGVVSEEDAAKAGALADSLDRTKFVVNALKTQVAVALMPAVTEVIDGFRSWIVANKDLIRTGIERSLAFLSTVIGIVWSAVSTLVGGIIDAVKWLLQFKVVTYGAAAALAFFVAVKTGQFLQQLGTSILGTTQLLMGFARAALGAGAASAAALVWPAIIGAIAIGLALLIEDFMVFKAGGDSVIGGLVEQFPQLLPIITMVSDGIAAVIEWAVQLWETIKPALVELGNALLNLFQAAWPVISAVLKAIGQAIMFLLPIILRVVTFLVTSFAQGITLVTRVVAWLVSAFSSVVNGIASLITWVTDFVVAAWNTAVMLVTAYVNIWVAVFQAIGAAISAAVQWVTSTVIALWNAAVQTVASAINWLQGIFSAAWSAIAGGFSAAINAVIGVVDGLISKISSAFNYLKELVGFSGSATVSAPRVAGAGASPVSYTPTSGRTGGLGFASGGRYTQASYSSNLQTGPINVYSPNPSQAGASVKQALNGRAARTSTRNNQSGVLL